MNSAMYFDTLVPSSTGYHGQQQQQQQQQQQHQHHQPPRQQHNQQHPPQIHRHQHQQLRHRHQLPQQQPHQHQQPAHHPPSHLQHLHDLSQLHPSAGRHTVHPVALHSESTLGIATSSASSLSSLFAPDQNGSIGASLADRPGSAFSAPGLSKFDLPATAQPWANPAPPQLYDLATRPLASAASCTSLSAAAAAVATLPRQSKNGGPTLHSVSSMGSSLSAAAAAAAAAGMSSKSQHWFGHPSNPPAFQQHPSPHTQHLPSIATPQMQQQHHSFQPQSSRLLSDISSDVDEDLIPTAIVIKNIPFAVKKEQLVQVMTELQLPLPYAFNYHFDNGVFRGLAFANFTSAEETAIVIDNLNHFELQGRKLRVEYKKMLPAAERERIEREKRERRGQLEEQHRPMPPVQLHSLPSHSSLSSHMTAASPSPVSMNNPPIHVDMNDKFTLDIYTELLLFKQNPARESLQFPAHLKPEQRRIIHTLAQGLHLHHGANGEGSQRYAFVVKPPPADSDRHSPVAAPREYTRPLTTAASLNILPSSSHFGFHDDHGQSLKPSSGFLGPSASGMSDYSAPSFSLRSAKSYADLRSITPSPVPSTASFPAALASFNGQPFSLASKPAGGNTLHGRTDDNFPSPIGLLRLGSYATTKTGDSPSCSGTIPRPIGDRYAAKNRSAASTPSFESTELRPSDMHLSSMNSTIGRNGSAFVSRSQFSSHGQENSSKEISVE